MAREGDVLVSPEPSEESKVLQFLPGFGFCRVETFISLWEKQKVREIKSPRRTEA